MDEEAIAREEEPSRQRQEPGQESHRAGVPWGLAGSLLLLSAVVVFAVQNTQPVLLEFLGWEAVVPLVVVVMVAFVVAVLFDEVLGVVWRRRRARRAADREELRRLREGR
jgi:uncharacterized integral membrane protein